LANLDLLYESVVKGDAKTAEAVAQEALAERIDPQELVSKYMIPAMDEIGRRFEANEVFVPELMVAARAMKAAMKHVDPLLKNVERASCTRIVLGTVQGDLHDIGKNLVGSLLSGGGFEVIDLGVNVSPDKFIQAVQESRARIVALSALLTTTMPAMRIIIEALESAGLRDRVKIIIGGAPITQDYAEQIGADGYGKTASNAVALARQVSATPKVNA
jgi:5-methyltetrahydrofolate--homocysteine methyltransferase